MLDEDIKPQVICLHGQSVAMQQEGEGQSDEARLYADAEGKNCSSPDLWVSCMKEPTQ